MLLLRQYLRCPDPAVKSTRRAMVCQYCRRGHIQVLAAVFRVIPEAIFLWSNTLPGWPAVLPVSSNSAELSDFFSDDILGLLRCNCEPSFIELHYRHVLYLTSFLIRYSILTQLSSRIRIRKVAGLYFSSDLILVQSHYGPGVNPASNRNEYQESSLGKKGRPAREAENLTAICEPIV
jgi:hypothetical protein